MALTVQFNQEAQKELLDAIDYYENKQKGLGLHFNTIVSQTINKISDFPKAFPIVYDNKRKAVLKPYPYLIIYEYEIIDNTIYILSIFHSRQDPIIGKNGIDVNRLTPIECMLKLSALVKEKHF